MNVRVHITLNSVTVSPIKLHQNLTNDLGVQEEEEEEEEEEEVDCEHIFEALSG
jgi:hypothetical protein